MAAHGTIGRYSHGKCRCTQCRHANKVYQAKYKAGLIEPLVFATNVRRHLRFLATNGWSLRSIATHLGIDFMTIQGLASGRQRKLFRATEERILAIHTAYAPYKGKPSLGRTPKWKVTA